MYNSGINNAQQTDVFPQKCSLSAESWNKFTVKQSNSQEAESGKR